MIAIWLTVSLIGAPGSIERDGPRPSAPRADASPIGVLDQESRIDRKLPAFRLDQLPNLTQDVQDAVFLAQHQPVKIRLRLRRHEGSLITPWLKQLRTLYDYLDRDRSGTLNAYEMEFAFSARNMQNMLYGSYSIRTANDPVSLAQVDRDRDGAVSFDEYAAYLLSITNSLVRTFPTGYGDPFASQLTRELFTMLDQNRDDRLTANEVKNLESLSTRDDDEDECLSSVELVPNLFTRPIQPVMPVRLNQGSSVTAGPFQVVPAGQIPESIVQSIMKLYDQNNDQLLSPTEITIAPETYQKLDIDANGQLNAAELDGWRRLRADVELEMVIGDDPKQYATQLTHLAKGTPIVYEAGEAGRAFLRLGAKQHIEFIPTHRAPVLNVVDNVLAGVNQSFDLVDAKKRGYIFEHEIGAGPQFQFLRIVFDAADHNMDGKLTRQEYEDHFRVQLHFGQVSLGLSYATEVPSLFTMLDGNRDGRLSVREMRQAWERLRELQGANTTEVTQDILQPQGSIRFGPSNGLSFAQQPINVLNRNPVAPSPTDGPVWFRKMDRNGDGDISPREFLGVDAEFHRIDKNGDGLISRDEAEIASKR